MMTTNLFIIANVKQLRTHVVLEFYCLFFRTSWGVGVLNSAIFNSFHNSGWIWHDFGGPSELRGAGGLNTPTPPRYATVFFMVRLLMHQPMCCVLAFFIRTMYAMQVHTIIVRRSWKVHTQGRQVTAKRKVFGPPATVDGLRIFALNRKDCQLQSDLRLGWKD